MLSKLIVAALPTLALASRQQITFTSAVETSTGSDIPEGAIIINVVPSTTGAATGCLGTGGMWSLGACAPFNITQYNTTAVNTTVTLNNFTLETTEGFCSGEKGVFSCSKKVLVPSYFQADLNSSSLVFNATGDFYAPMVPVIPWMKLPVLTTFKLGNVNVTLSYSAAPEVPPVV